MAKRKPITAEEFAAWRDDPVTKLVMQAHSALAEQQKAGWLEATWEGGHVDPLLLTELKTRADAYRAIADCTFEDIVGSDE